MGSRVVFTRDFAGESGLRNGGRDAEVTNESKKLYTRVRITNSDPTWKKTLSNEVEKTSDPVLSYLSGTLAKHEPTDESLEDCGNVIVWVDILGFKDDDFVQYQGQIDSTAIRKVTEEGIAKGIGLSDLHIWIYGLLIDGKYDGSNYEFGLIKVDDSFFWSITILHLGLFKMLCKVKLKKKLTIDIDEFFVEDLERFYKETIEHRRKEEEWKLEKAKYVNQIKLLNDKKKMEKLSNSVRLMKGRISNYFLPLVNSLLEDKRELIKKMNGMGDIVFSSTRKRNTAHLDNDRKEIKIEDEVQQGKKIDREDEDLDWMQRERNKRMKLNHDIPKIINETSEPQLVETARVSSATDDSLVFNKRDKGFMIETQPDLIETVANASKEANSRDSSVILEEETQADEETDVSQEKGKDFTEMSGEVTEISDS